MGSVSHFLKLLFDILCVKLEYAMHNVLYSPAYHAVMWRFLVYPYYIKILL